MLWLRAISSFLKKVKKFVVEYWQAFVALILVLVGYVIGTRGDTSKVDKSDISSQKDHTNRMVKGQAKIYEERIKEIEKSSEEHANKVEEIRSKTEEEIKELSNDPKKLDKILKEKYNLNKGE